MVIKAKRINANLKKKRNINKRSTGICSYTYLFLLAPIIYIVYLPGVTVNSVQTVVPYVLNITLVVSVSRVTSSGDARSTFIDPELFLLLVIPPPQFDSVQ